MGLVYAYECLFLVLLLIPCHEIYSMFVNKDKYDDEEYIKSFGALFEDYKTDTNL
jgi:hypothetical protein